MDTGMVITPLLWVVSLLLVGVGMAGILLPALPGVPLVFAGLLLAAWGDGFQHVGVWTIAALGFLTVLGFVVDFVAGTLGAQRAGASREAIIGAAIGTFVGIFFGIPGIIFGPFLGAVIGELVARQSIGQAGRAGVATWLGFIFGLGIKLVLAFTMLGIFIIAYIF